MRPVSVQLGSSRTDSDGCRRYRPIELTFDSRNATLVQEIGDDWEAGVQEQWRSNQSAIRMGLLAELGTIDGEAKIDNYRAMGSAPWSVVFQHNVILAQTRAALSHGDFYPALVSACALGERIFNQLILVLRDDYVNHSATTRRVRKAETFTDWGSCIEVLRGWGVFSDDLALKYLELEKQRHTSVHFDPDSPIESRAPALNALHLIQSIIGELFAPLGGPPVYIGGIPGASFIALESEQIPLIKRIFLPRCALLSPAHRFYIEPADGGTTWHIVDDADYDSTPLSDQQFAEAIPAGSASMHPEFASRDADVPAGSEEGRPEEGRP